MNKIKAGLISLRDLLATAWWVFAILAAGFALSFTFVKPAPPKQAVITTDHLGSAYFRFAGRYSAVFARNEIALEVRPSAGSKENLERLEKGEAQIALIQGGTIEPDPDLYSFEERPLLSMGNVFYEPLWVFYRGKQQLERLDQLSGKRLAIGPEGGNIRNLALQLLEANGISRHSDQLLPIADDKAVDELLKGKIDAVFVIGAVETPSVQTLLRNPDVRLMSFSQAEAYQRRFPFLSKIVLPQGVVDFKHNLPPQDTVLLAATASLVIRRDLHPALQVMLMQAASEEHGKHGLFQKRNEFPSERENALPLSEEAQRYLKNGPPFLMRYLPFWLAVLVERLFVLIVPAFILLLPLIKVAPTLYSWRIRSRIFRLYGELKFLENDLKKQPSPGNTKEYLRRLDNIEAEANTLSIPLAFTDLIYTLREHINLVRRTFFRLESPQPSTTAPDSAS